LISTLQTYRIQVTRSETKYPQAEIGEDMSIPGWNIHIVQNAKEQQAIGAKYHNCVGQIDSYFRNVQAGFLLFTLIPTESTIQLLSFSKDETKGILVYATPHGKLKEANGFANRLTKRGMLPPEKEAVRQALNLLVSRKSQA
jgi:hypothetical protein